MASPKRRGRHPFTQARKNWIANIPADLEAEIRILLTDPITGRIKYGAASRLTEALLREWLRKQKEAFAAGNLDTIGPDLTGLYSNIRNDEEESE